VDESGRPVTDLSHVLTQLNKLDSGVEEKLMLVSRDEGSCLIVSYREVSLFICSKWEEMGADSRGEFPRMSIVEECDRGSLC